MPERCPVCGTPQFVLVDHGDGRGWRCPDWAACLLTQESLAAEKGDDE